MSGRGSQRRFAPKAPAARTPAAQATPEAALKHEEVHDDDAFASLERAHASRPKQSSAGTTTTTTTAAKKSTSSKKPSTKREGKPASGRGGGSSAPKHPSRPPGVEALSGDEDDDDAEAAWPANLNELFDIDSNHPDMVPYADPAVAPPNPNDPSLRRLANLLEQQMTLDDAAAELGIFDTDGERCILMQLPSKVPRKGTPSKSGVPAPHASSIDVIPDGKIGQLRVFETGAIKLELGNVLMDVTPVPRNSFRQDLVSIQNSKDATARGAWWLAEIATRATVTPDLEQLLEEQPIAVWEEAEVPERYAEQRIKEKPEPGMEDEKVEMREEMMMDEEDDVDMQEVVEDELVHEGHARVESDG